MQRHDVDGIQILVLVGVHDEGDMFEEAAQALELLHERMSSFRFSSRPGASADLSFCHMAV